MLAVPDQSLSTRQPARGSGITKAAPAAVNQFGSYTTKTTSPGYAPYGVPTTSTTPSLPSSGAPIPGGRDSGRLVPGGRDSRPTPYVPGVEPAPHSPGGREYGSDAARDPYLDYLYGQGSAVFGEQGMQNAYLDSQYNRNVAPGFLLDQQDLQAQYDRNMAGLNGQVARNDITRQGNLANIGFADRGLGDSKLSTGDQRGFNTMDAAQQRMYAAQLSALASRQFGLGNEQNQFAYDQTSRRDRSDATGRGAIGSLGFQQDNQFNQRNLGLANQNNQLGYDSSTTGINNSLTQGLLGIDRSNAGLAAQDRAAQLSRDQKVSDAQLSNQVVDSLAKEYGVTADQLNGALDRGLQRVGLSRQTAIDGLAEAKRQGNAQAVATWNQILAEALGYAGQSGYTPPAIPSAYAPAPAYAPAAPSASNVAKIFGPAPAAKPAPKPAPKSAGKVKAI